MSDEVTLTLPRARPFYGIAHLVVAGLAARLDLTFENLEDLQLALAGVLERPDEDGEVTVSLRLDGDVLHTRVGPFDPDRLGRDLDRTGGENLSLRRLLETVMDRVDVGEERGASWLELTKTIAVGAGG